MFIVSCTGDTENAVVSQGTTAVQEGQVCNLADEDVDGYVFDPDHCRGEGDVLDCDDGDSTVTDECYDYSAHAEQEEQHGDDDTAAVPFVGVIRNARAPWCEGVYTHVRLRCDDSTGYTEAVRPLEDDVFTGFDPEECSSWLVHVNVGTYEDGRFSPNLEMANLYDVSTGNRAIDVIAGESAEDDEFEEFDLLDPLPCVDLWDPEQGLGYGPYAMERECGSY